MSIYSGSCSGSTPEWGVLRSPTGHTAGERLSSPNCVPSVLCGTGWDTTSGRLGCMFVSFRGTETVHHRLVLAHVPDLRGDSVLSVAAYPSTRATLDRYLPLRLGSQYLGPGTGCGQAGKGPPRTRPSGGRGEQQPWSLKSEHAGFRFTKLGITYSIFKSYSRAWLMSDGCSLTPSIGRGVAADL